MPGSIFYYVSHTNSHTVHTLYTHSYTHTHTHTHTGQPAPVSEAPSKPSTTTAIPSTPTKSHLTFEDKKKENFDAGRQELERRRRALQEKQEKEEAEKERKRRQEEEQRRQQE